MGMRLLLVLLLACCASIRALARDLEITQRSFVVSEDVASEKQEPMSASHFAETGRAKLAFHELGLEEILDETGPEQNPFLHGTGDEGNIISTSALYPKSVSLPLLSRTEDLSISRDEEMHVLSLSHTKDILPLEPELVLHEDGTIPSLLDQNGLPIGLLPSSVASHSITDEGEFTVTLEKPCYVKFDYEVYYAETITGKLSYGTITNLSGIQAKEAFFWVPVTGIRTDIPSSEYIYFDVGPISKKLSISQFQTIRVCKVKAIASSALA